nr:hypothetical protein [Tanacetum cinerariifolium]
VHSEARSWSIPSEDPYEEAAQQLFEQAPHSLEYVPRDHVPVFVLEFEHPEDLVPAEDEAPASLLPPRFLSPRIRPLSLRALGAEMNAIASSLYHSLHPSGTPLLLPIPLSTPSTSRRAGILKADTPPQNRPLLATPRPGCEVEESSTAATRWPGPTMAHEKDHAAVRAEIEDLRSERLAYEQEGIQTRKALARSEACCKALEARVAVLETHVRRLEWQRTEGAVGLTHWIEKIESVFNINGCTVENQVKFATCTLLDATLTWWNSQIRTLGPNAYMMTWSVLKKKMTDKYCPLGEAKKLEIELWNLKVDKYISGLLDNIYGNIKSSKPKTLDETIELANNLIDQKLRTYVERKSDGKRKEDDISRNN